MLPPPPARVLAAITSSHIDDESAKRNLDTSIIRCRAASDTCSLITPVSVAFICHQLIDSGITQISPLLAQSMTRLAAAVLLATFPNTTMTASYLRGPGQVTPAAVRRAAEFIEACAGQPITVTEIAAAAGISARALQYAFRRHYDTTPMGYMRQVRLERAHSQLEAADPTTGVSVAAVARRRGWANPANFAAAYRKQYGTPPSHTLHT